ncbi:inositol 1,4,5-trisphosphate receptor-interacting protein-like 1 [Falco peregrinus]|uniref:inositol 1,4,5-trisphosphate receptor-interacting protein-like 1 n=1 Tax=Falco peregrinus TaxID=8954 RepID=UPI002479183D|nr:inositol 1,4,5-trisphosphate receptor-interacting protein-like 1 [Falco peregrinus]
MAAAIALILAILAMQPTQKGLHRRDMATDERMRQRKAYLDEQTTRVMQEVDRSWGTFLPTLQQWPLWTVAGALVLLASVCWLVRKMKLASGSRSEQDRKEDDGEEEDLHGALSGGISMAVSTPPPMQDLPDTCEALKELVGDLLKVCQILCKRSFLPELYPATGEEGACETWSVHGNSITYRLPVLLWPPPGHSFTLEPDTAGQLPEGQPSIRVGLECVCLRQQLLGDEPCLLHHPEVQLPRDQKSFLLYTLCTRSCLDMDKVTYWVQELVKAAWLLLPESSHCHLTLLPSFKSCRFHLTSSSEIDICTELIFVVPPGAYGGLE